MVNLKDLQKTRDKQGIYFLYNQDKELIYIGQSRNIYIRLLEHIAENKKQFDSFKAIKIDDSDFMELMEIYLIQLYKETHNLLNRLTIKFDFENFFLNVPSSIRLKYNLNNFIEYHKEIENFISNKLDFNSMFFSNKMKDDLLMELLNER